MWHTHQPLAQEGDGASPAPQHRLTFEGFSSSVTQIICPLLTNEETDVRELQTPTSQTCCALPSILHFLLPKEPSPGAKTHQCRRRHRAASLATCHHQLATIKQTPPKCHRVKSLESIHRGEEGQSPLSFVTWQCGPEGYLDSILTVPGNLKQAPSAHHALFQTHVGQGNSVRDLYF